MEPPAEPSTDETLGLQVLEIQVGARWWRLPLGEVLSVARQVPLVGVPDAVDEVLGLANVRGTLVTVLDFERIVTGSVIPRDVTMEAASIVLLSRWDGRVALAVDRCGQVLPHDADDVVDVPAIVMPWLATGNEEHEVGR
ncbi:MAG: chemotaxis protein CheW [Gemmatimonadaceae bacterium]|nr:chemotaxis protein CheW [Gemmatimonadaceae bacterium]